MRKVIFLSGFMLLWTLCSVCAFAASKTGLVTWWKFDEGKGKTAIDSISQKEDSIQGNFQYLPGVSGPTHPWKRS